jgi:hypothetical protein
MLIKSRKTRFHHIFLALFVTCQRQPLRVFHQRNLPKIYRLVPLFLPCWAGSVHQQGKCFGRHISFLHRWQVVKLKMAENGVSDDSLWTDPLDTGRFLMDGPFDVVKSLFDISSCWPNFLNVEIPSTEYTMHLITIYHHIYLKWVNKHNNCLEHYFFLKLKNSQLHGTKTNNKFYYVL